MYDCYIDQQLVYPTVDVHLNIHDHFGFHSSIVGIHYDDHYSLVNEANQLKMFPGSPTHVKHTNKYKVHKSESVKN